MNAALMSVRDFFQNMIFFKHRKTHFHTLIYTDHVAYISLFSDTVYRASHRGTLVWI